MSLPPYDNYKDSGVEWLGNIPGTWDVTRLKKATRLQTEKTDRRSHPVALENIESWSGRFIETNTEFEGDGVGFCIGDILFGKLRPYLAKAYLASNDGEAVGDFHVLRPGAKVDARFAQYQLLTREFIAIVDGSTFGAKMPRASWDFMGNMPLVLPSLPEQQLIADFLDRETTKIDTLIAEQVQLIALLKEKRQAVISHAVTKGLNPDAPMKDSGIEWVGLTPQGWVVCALTRMAERIVVGIAEAATHAYAETGTPILRSTNIRAGKIIGEILCVDPTFSGDRGSKEIRAGDLVSVRTGAAGVTAVIPTELDGCQCFTMLITTLRPVVIPAYACYWMNSYAAQTYFSLEGWGTAQINISVPILKALPLPVPPMEEQIAIVRFLDDAVSKIDGLLDEAGKAISLLNERRSALISAAVTGKIDVRKAA